MSTRAQKIKELTKRTINSELYTEEMPLGLVLALEEMIEEMRGSLYFHKARKISINYGDVLTGFDYKETASGYLDITTEPNEALMLVDNVGTPKKKEYLLVDNIVMIMRGEEVIYKHPTYHDVAGAIPTRKDNLGSKRKLRKIG